VTKLTVDEMWEKMLTGNFPRLQRMRQIWGVLPSPPRCKLCNAPFRGPGGVLMRALAYGPSTLNRRLCKWCIRAMHKHPGGAEVEISVLFADVRGSTSLAERMPPDEFSRLMARFYGAAAGVIDAWDGIVDKFVGDGAVALFIPGFAGSEHATNAIAAARSNSVLRRVHEDAAGHARHRDADRSARDHPRPLGRRSESGARSRPGRVARAR
jgi:adenylate cyclase